MKFLLTKPFQIFHYFQVEFLTKNTTYDSLEIIEWFSAFMEDNPEGALSKVSMTFEINA